jgi:hypothetical protein
VTPMAALTAGVDRPGAIADLGPGGPPAARTSGPTGGDRSAVVSSGTRTVRSWPLLVLGAPAAAEVWSGWVGIAQKTGFGLVSPLPGILPSLHLDTSITLPVGVEDYAAYALRAWLARDRTISDRTRPARPTTWVAPPFPKRWPTPHTLPFDIRLRFLRLPRGQPPLPAVRFRFWPK